MAVRNDIIDHFRTLLEAQVQALLSSVGPIPDCGLVRPFNTTLLQEHRKMAMAKLRTGEIRFLVSADAAGMVSITFFFYAIVPNDLC